VSTDDPAARERRNYVRDAWGDVGVTAAFATGLAIATAIHRFLEDPSFLAATTLWTFEFGFAAVVIDHVAKQVWYRTFFGSAIRAAWKWFSTRNKGGGGGHDSGDSGRHSTPDKPSHQSAGGETTSYSVLNHPPAGTVWPRALNSIYFGCAAAVLFLLWTLFSSLISDGHILAVVAITIAIVVPVIWFIVRHNGYTRTNTSTMTEQRDYRPVLPAYPYPKGSPAFSARMLSHPRWQLFFAILGTVAAIIGIIGALSSLWQR
jgi:hypothetical protein